MTLSFTVHGLPAPQGSKRYVGKGRMIESSKNVKPWREAVKWAAIEAMREQEWLPVLDALAIELVFRLPMPRSIPKKKRETAWPIKRPDIDKLVRSSLDAISESGAWRDDAQVCRLNVQKQYVIDDDVWPAGASVIVKVLE